MTEPTTSLITLARSATLDPVTNDRAGEHSTAFCTTLILPLSLDCFDGHFPKNPVMPGVAQIALVRLLASQWLGQTLSLERVNSARMTEMLVPSEELRWRVTLTPDPDNPELWRAIADIHNAEKRCTRLSLDLRQPFRPA